MDEYGTLLLDLGDSVVRQALLGDAFARLILMEEWFYMKPPHSASQLQLISLCSLWYLNQ